MSRLWALLVVTLATAIVLQLDTAHGAATPYVAYSLGEAAARLRAGGAADSELLALGGLNVIAGGVYDASRRDIILIGRHVPGQPAVSLDDLVVALRTVVLLDSVPAVSIDPTEQTPTTGVQEVRFKGALANTQHGLDFLTADVLLKSLSLGVETPPWPDAKSYLDRNAEHRARRAADDGLTVGTRFWFNLSTEARLVDRPGAGVFAVVTLPMIVEREVLYARLSGDAADVAAPEDPAADAYASALSSRFNELCERYPALARLRVLFSLAAVARGIGTMTPGEELRYWLHEHPVRTVATPTQHPLQRRRTTYRDKLGRESFVEVSGGLEVQAILRRLQAGEVTALRDAVLGSRPDGRALTWKVPIEDWRIPWAEPFLHEQTAQAPAATSAEPLGAFFSTRSGLSDSSRSSAGSSYAPAPPPFRSRPLQISPVPELPKSGTPPSSKGYTPPSMSSYAPLSTPKSDPVTQTPSFTSPPMPRYWTPPYTPPYRPPYTPPPPPRYSPPPYTPPPPRLR